MATKWYSIQNKKYYNEAYLYLPSLLSPEERDRSTKHENKDTVVDTVIDIK